MAFPPGIDAHEAGMWLEGVADGQLEEVGVADARQRAAVGQFHPGRGRKVGDDNLPAGPWLHAEHRMRVMVAPGGDAELFRGKWLRDVSS